jgi:hypothetical protein
MQVHHGGDHSLACLDSYICAINFEGARVARAYFARIIGSIEASSEQPTNEPEKIDIPETTRAAEPAQDRVTTRSQASRLINIAIEMMEGTESREKKSLSFWRGL